MIHLIDFYPATSFQKKVWKALLTIPKGQIRSYEWVAKKIGAPRAVRAVGTAVGKNPFAPHVPCHRVIRKNGSLGNYSGPGGIKQKIFLLTQEGYRRPLTTSSIRPTV